VFIRRARALHFTSHPLPEPAETGDFVVSLCSPASGVSTAVGRGSRRAHDTEGTPRSFKLASLPTSGCRGMVGCFISRRHKSCYAQSRPRHRTRCRRTPVRWGPRRLPPSSRRPGSLDITASCGQGKLRDRHRPCDEPPDLALVRGRGRCPALRQTARHGFRRAERSAAFGDLRGGRLSIDLENKASRPRTPRRLGWGTLLKKRTPVGTV
jgi:hypothetical protein